MCGSVAVLVEHQHWLRLRLRQLQHAASHNSWQPLWTTVTSSTVDCLAGSTGGTPTWMTGSRLRNSSTLALNLGTSLLGVSPRSILNTLLWKLRWPRWEKIKPSQHNPNHKRMHASPKQANQHQHNPTTSRLCT